MNQNLFGSISEINDPIFIQQDTAFKLRDLREELIWDLMMMMINKWQKKKLKFNLKVPQFQFSSKFKWQ